VTSVCKRFSVCYPTFTHRLKWRQDITENDFQYGSRPPSWFCENCRFDHVTYICMWFFISGPNFALIGCYCTEYSQKRFSIWRPSAILNLQNFDLLNPGNWNVHPRTKFDRNRIIHSWDMEIKPFSQWRQSAVFNLRNCSFGHVTYTTWLFISDPNFALIGQYGTEISTTTIFNMASVRHLGFVMMSSYCIENRILRSQLCDEFSRRSVA